VVDRVNEYWSVAWLLSVSAGILLAVLFVYYLHRWHRRRKHALLGYGLIITALIYVVLAAISANALWIVIEVVGSLLFLLLVWMAYQYSFWFLAMGWLIHIVWDIGGHPFSNAPYIPDWYPAMCAGFDLVVGLYIVGMLVSHSRRADSRG